MNPRAGERGDRDVYRDVYRDVDQPADRRIDEDIDEGFGDEQAVPARVAWEAPEADAAEQRQGVRPAPARWPTRSLPFDVDPADAADQDRLVELDEDDYR